MRKKIAVFVQEIWSDYNKSLIKGILDFYNGKDVDVFLSQIRIPLYEEDAFGMQYWSCLRVAACDDIDAVIVCSPTFCSTISPDELSKKLEPISDKKIVSVSIPLELKNCRHTSVSCRKAYSEFVSHMIKQHGSKKFAFMSANIENSVEARERLDAFKNALKENNLELEEDKIFYGNFMFDDGPKELSKKYKSKENIDFDTIFAANDMMAFGCISYLKHLGVKVPEEVKVVGYDDIPQASTDDLTLSTINQQIEFQGETAAKLALDWANENEIPQNTLIEARPIFRESCGCNIEKTNIELTHAEDERAAALIRNDWGLNRIHNLLDNTQSDETLQVFFDKMYDIMSFNEINFAAVCLYQDPVFVDIGEIPEIPGNAKLAFFVDNKKGIREINTHYEFNLRKHFLAEEFDQNEACHMLVQSIFYGDFSYGYILLQTDNVSITLHSVYLKILANEIAQAYKYTRNIEEKAALAKMNLDLNIKSFTDELTGLVNRRGLMKYGKESINLSIQLEKNGVVLFCDMDHLKVINDTYGHEYGDIAIKAQSEILQKTFRVNDMISRLGGDEFVIIAPGLSISQLDQVRQRMKGVSEEIQKEKKLPFEVSISIGGVPYNAENTDLERLIMSADKEQYEEKKRHHAQRQ
ncbi:MAG: GGDEF domain-containing protein [Treponema sp.]|uniref:GGDEF domain-containing protein n=1 Tax=Treponema sp. TaxID=166 RepID=UPI00298E8519|nr:GGDEF domain-containing protein [Treponema sp.]MCR5385693.1 GGDEF domain-containing protein [Treponema sp.]